MALEDIIGRVSDLAQAGAAKAKAIAEITKLKVNNAGEEDTIRKAYIEIGKMYYKDRVMAPDAQFAPLCAKITACKEKIEANNQKIAEIKATDNIKEEDIPEESQAVVAVEETAQEQ